MDIPIGSWVSARVRSSYALQTNMKWSNWKYSLLTGNQCSMRTTSNFRWTWSWWRRSSFSSIQSEGPGLGASGGAAGIVFTWNTNILNEWTVLILLMLRSTGVMYHILKQRKKLTVFMNKIREFWTSRFVDLVNCTVGKELWRNFYWSFLGKKHAQMMS